MIRNSIKCVPLITGNLLQPTRGYAVMKKLPVTWIRPEKVSCISVEKSGDGGLDFNISPNDFLKSCAMSKELADADELVQRMLSINFNRRKELVTLQRQKALEKVMRHNHDRGSMESKISSITVQILQLQEHQKNFPKNSKTKVMLKELIEKRKKWLKKLRLQDYARFEYLLESLNLTYHPSPEENPYITEKDASKRQLKKYCDELKQKKLDEYKAELEAQQKDFFIEKAQKLEFMRNEEITCGVTPTISEKEVEAAKQKAAQYA